MGVNRKCIISVLRNFVKAIFRPPRVCLACPGASPGPSATVAGVESNNNKINYRKRRNETERKKLEP